MTSCAPREGLSRIDVFGLLGFKTPSSLCFTPETTTHSFVAADLPPHVEDITRTLLVCLKLLEV